MTEASASGNAGSREEHRRKERYSMTLRKLLAGGPAHIEITIDGDRATHKVIDDSGNATTTWSMPCSHTNFGSKDAILNHCFANGYVTIAE